MTCPEEYREHMEYISGTTDEYFQTPEPDEEYMLTLCGDTAIFSGGLLL